MRPGDNFSLVNSDKISFDVKTFSRLYLPIIGKNAFVLYQLLMASSQGKFSDLMDDLNIGQNRLEDAFDELMGLSLVQLFDRHTDFRIILKSPLNFEDFMADDLLLQLLISKIGEKNVKRLYPEKSEGVNLTKKFSEVYNVDLDDGKEEVGGKNEVREAGLKKSNSFTNSLDIENFKALMKKRDYYFANENVDLLHLYSISEKFSLDWYALFKLAEETANADRTINTSAMIRKQVIASDKQKVQIPSAYQELIKIAKSVVPEDFLTQLKRQLGGFVTRDELKLLSNFSKQKIPPEVQNILIHYTIVQQKHSNLTAVFVNRIANDWLRNKVATAEQAIQRIREFAQDKKTVKKPASNKKKLVKKQPTWSNPEYKNKTSSEDLERLQQLQKKALEKIGGNDGAYHK